MPGILRVTRVRRAEKQTRATRAYAGHRFNAGDAWEGFTGESHGPQPDRGNLAVRDDMGGKGNVARHGTRHRRCTDEGAGKRQLPVADRRRVLVLSQPYGERLGAAMLAPGPAGEGPAGGTCPVAAVVIPGGGKGDQPTGSPEVKASVGWADGPVRSAREANNSAGRSESEPVKPRKSPFHQKRMVGNLGVPSRSSLGEGQCCRRRNWARATDGFPGVVEDGMPRRTAERKHGTARGSPRRARTAKASRISCKAVKSRRAHEWDGWGRLSGDGPGQHNLDRSEDPWGRAAPSARTVVPKRAGCSDTERSVQRRHDEHEGRGQTE